MSETSFAINDLLRRKTQTALVIISLALSVGSTLFLLLFAEKIGLGITLSVENKLTAGFSTIFSPFVLLLAILIIGAGVVMTSFMVSLMMSQRARDIGLIKAAGCPGDFVFGYFFTELIVVVLLGCFLGVFMGVLADYSSSFLFGFLGLQVGSFGLDLWSMLIVFVLFLVVGLIVGGKSIVDASRTTPIKALSPEYRFGVVRETRFRPLSTRRIALAVAMRSIIRRQSATVKIVICMSMVFTLVTVGIAGGLIANQTTRSWVEQAIGTDIVLVGHIEMCNRYALLLERFYESNSLPEFNYTDLRYVIPQGLIAQLTTQYSSANVEGRIVVETTVHEVQGYVFNDETQSFETVGDNRESQSLIVGIDPERTLGNWYLDGRLPSSNKSYEVVVGDTLSRGLFSVPLSQKLKIFNSNLNVVGVSIDPINNGIVTYVPYDILQAAVNMSGPNIVLLKNENSTGKAETLQQLNATVKAIDKDFSVLDLNEFLDKSLGFLDYTWSTVMVLPFFSLLGASLCLLGYVALVMEEQRHEFGVMRAVGANSNTVLSIVSEQSLLVLLSSYGVGVSMGIIITLLILILNPVITSYTVLQIAGLQAIALAITSLSSLYPAIRFAHKPLVELLRQD